MVYICAWQAPPLQPARWISSRIAAAADSGSPAPPYSSGISADEVAGLGQRIDELRRIGPLAVELAPVLAGEAGAELCDGVADVVEFVLLFLCGHLIFWRWMVGDVNCRIAGGCETTAGLLC